MHYLAWAVGGSTVGQGGQLLRLSLLQRSRPAELDGPEVEPFSSELLFQSQKELEKPTESAKHKFKPLIEEPIKSKLGDLKQWIELIKLTISQKLRQFCALSVPLNYFEPHNLWRFRRLVPQSARPSPPLNKQRSVRHLTVIQIGTRMLYTFPTETHAARIVRNSTR